MPEVSGGSFPQQKPIHFAGLLLLPRYLLLGLTNEKLTDQGSLHDLQSQLRVPESRQLLGVREPQCLQGVQAEVLPLPDQRMSSLSPGAHIELLQLPRLEDLHWVQRVLLPPKQHVQPDSPHSILPQL